MGDRSHSRERVCSRVGTVLLCPGRKGRGSDVLHVISDGKLGPFTEIGVALTRFSDYEIGVEANRSPLEANRFRGVSFLPCVCSFVLLVVFWLSELTTGQLRYQGGPILTTGQRPVSKRLA